MAYICTQVVAIDTHYVAGIVVGVTQWPVVWSELAPH